mmetsp:Transcript_10893/g.31002  ORF Transcript_10893/g.31002 Transcript_10893/m.31002 type:complete len:325 (+) Transcript_10893:20-994(+)
MPCGLQPNGFPSALAHQHVPRPEAGAGGRHRHGHRCRPVLRVLKPVKAVVQQFHSKGGRATRGSRHRGVHRRALHLLILLFVAARSAAVPVRLAPPDRSARGPGAVTVAFVVRITRAQVRCDRLDDTLNIEAHRSGVGNIGSTGDHLNQAGAVVGDDPDTLGGAQVPREPLSGQMKECAVAEGVAIFPQNIVRPGPEEPAQKLGHLPSTILAESEEDPVRLGPPPMADNLLRLCDAGGAEVILCAIDEHRGVVADSASHPSARHTQFDLMAFRHGRPCGRIHPGNAARTADRAPLEHHAAATNISSAALLRRSGGFQIAATNMA